ncbi:hypothetical protein EZS27_044022, partial [termite gut metagenome]
PKNEHIYYEKYPAFYETIPEKRAPKPRGKNTLIDCFCRIRTFCLWCYDKKKTANRPFDEFHIDECTYGTPVYITLQERNILFEQDLSDHPEIEVQRDIFVFQSLIGCRIGDFYRMTKRNLINGAIEYIPRKTKEGSGYNMIYAKLLSIGKSLPIVYEDDDRVTVTVLKGFVNKEI